MPIKPVATRKRAASTLRIPFTYTEASSPDHKAEEEDARMRSKRLTSPVASIRPTEASSENATIVDEDTSGEEDDIPVAEGDNYAEPAQLQGTYSRELDTSLKVPPLPSVLRRVESIEGSSSTSATERDEEEDDAKPRKQKLRFAEDMYTPLWVRGAATHKEGLCDMCPAPGKWLQLKNSAFWYHKQFTHGVSSVSGARFTLPVQIRKNSTSGASEGLCHQCQQWITYTTKRQDASNGEIVPTLWYKHAHKCHVYDTSKVKTGTTAQRNSRTTAAGKKRRNMSAESGDYE